MAKVQPLFLDGFGHYATADITAKWDAVSATSAQAIAGAHPRWPGGAYWERASFPRYLTKSFPANAAWIIGMAVYPGSLASSGLLALYSGGASQLSLWTDASGALLVQRGDTASGPVLGSTPGGLAPNTWTYLELAVVIDGAAGSAHVWLNGASVLTLTGQNTKNASGSATADTLRLGSTFGSSMNVGVTDVYVWNGPTLVGQDPIGDCTVATLRPTADGAHSDWTPTPAGTHASAVDDSTPLTTDYVASSTDDAIDTYVYSDLAAGSVVRAVQVCSYAQKMDVGGRSLASAIRLGGVDYAGSDVALSATAKYALHLHAVSPATGVAWTADEVNGAEFGVKARP